MGVKRTRPVAESTVAMLNRSGTAPLCEHCGYRTLAIDSCRAACRHCGLIVHVQRWVIGLLLVTFDGRLTGGILRYADRT